MIRYTYILWNDRHIVEVTSFPIQLQNFFPVTRTFKIYSLCNVQLCGTVLLTIVSMLYTASQGLSHFITGSLYLLTPLLATGICLSLTHFTERNALQVHPCCCKWQDFLLSHG